MAVHPGLNVAGQIIAVVSKQPLQQFLKQRIFDPLGMNNTTFFPDEKQAKRIAVLYGLDADGKLVPDSHPITEGLQAPNPSSGLVSTARDLFRFYQMVLNGGKFRKQRILSQSAVEQMTSPQTDDLKTGFTPGNGWGLGWCIVREPQGVSGALSSGTFGHGGAFGTQGWVDPKTNTIHVLMIQRTKLPNSDNSAMRRALHDIASEHTNQLQRGR